MSFIEDVGSFVTSVAEAASTILTPIGAVQRAIQSYGPDTQYYGSRPPAVPMTRNEQLRRKYAIQLYTPWGVGGSGSIETYPGTSERNGSRYLPSGMRRYRRMNVLNPRALSRSIRRVKGFTKFASRVGHYTRPGTSYRLKGFGQKGKKR